MPKPANKSQLMKHLGAAQRNRVWSWCGINEENRTVYLSVWSDLRAERESGRPSYLVQGPDWGVDEESGDLSPARTDHDEKLAKVFDEGYDVFGYVIEAKDPKARPREIGKTKTSFIFELELERVPDGSILGYPVRRVEIK